MKNVP